MENFAQNRVRRNLVSDSIEALGAPVAFFKRGDSGFLVTEGKSSRNSSNVSPGCLVPAAKRARSGYAHAVATRNAKP